MKKLLAQDDLERLFLVPNVGEDNEERLQKWEERQRRIKTTSFFSYSGTPQRFIKLVESGELKPTPAYNEAKELLSNGTLFVLFYGKPGTGKTVAACNLMLDQLEGVYAKAVKLCRLGRSYDKRERYEFYKASIENFLVVDDVGIEPAAASYLIEEILDDRYEADLPTIMTSNLTPNEFLKRYDARIVSRMMHVGRSIACEKVLRPKGER